jgi:hypothetical protein
MRLLEGDAKVMGGAAVDSKYRLDGCGFENASKARSGDGPRSGRLAGKANDPRLEAALDTSVSNVLEGPANSTEGSDSFARTARNRPDDPNL